MTHNFIKLPVGPLAAPFPEFLATYLQPSLKFTSLIHPATTKEISWNYEQYMMFFMPQSVLIFWIARWQTKKYEKYKAETGALSACTLQVQNVS